MVNLHHISYVLKGLLIEKKVKNKKVKTKNDFLVLKPIT